MSYEVMKSYEGVYPREHQAEDIGVIEAAINGKCNECSYLADCEKCHDQPFPDDAWCMVRKREILKEWREKER